MTLDVSYAWTNPQLPWLADCVSRHRHLINQRLTHGDLKRWNQALADIPRNAGQPIFDREAVGLAAYPEPHLAALKTALRGLMPWRKGPFQFGSLVIDAEWRSDWKWNRIAPFLTLEGQRVLDVGSGSGYHLWRIYGAGAREVLGIEPSMLFNCQFAAVRALLGDHPVASLPLTLDAFDPGQLRFDTVLSMGVLYHRKDPIGHLEQLQGLLEPGGTLVLETLVIPGDTQAVLVPGARYARMNNVWFLPSVDHLIRWLERLGFEAIQHRGTTTTSTDEQRQTQWMQFESFVHALDPEDSESTIEGLPRPRRAFITARRPQTP